MSILRSSKRQQSRPLMAAVGVAALALGGAWLLLSLGVIP